MKTKNIIILVLTALFTVSCHSWDEPGADTGLGSYGNPGLKETNVKTIAEVKELFKSEIASSDLKKVEQPMQIKAVVIGNDEGGNIYKSLYIQDNTGAIALSIDQSGLFGPLAVGQCVLIELKNLYVGGYEKQPQIGTYYFNENKGVEQVGRMTRYEWQQHYKLLNAVEGLDVKPAVVSKMSKLSLENDCGKLVTLVGVKMKDADGEKVFAPSDGSVTLLGGCANREITGMSDVVVRTSTYAKFANMPMPTEKLTITGVASRYRDGWQLMPRTANDIKAYTGDEELDDPGIAASGTGTEADPFNVIAAIEAGTGTNVFVKAYIVGWIDGKTLAEGAKFNGEATAATNIIIAASADETDLSKCMPVQLPTGAVRTAVNLQDNPGNYKKEILLVGNIEKYFGAMGVKSVSYAKIGDQEAGTKPGGGSDSGTTGGDIQTVTVAQFNAAAESTSVWYQLTGTVKNIKDSDKYGNFDLEDETGSVYVYGLLAEKGGEKQKFQELVAAKGIANGKKITIIGNRGSFNGKVEVTNAYFVSVE